MDYQIIKQILRKEVHFLVESETTKGSFYQVKFLEDTVGSKWSCSCPHFTNRLEECKHIKMLQGENLSDII